jgi:hypothetical protein
LDQPTGGPHTNLPSVVDFFPQPWKNHPFVHELFLNMVIFPWIYYDIFNNHRVNGSSWTIYLAKWGLIVDASLYI